MKTLIFIVLILVQILIAFAVYRIVTKAMSKKRSEAESRLADLSQTAEGRAILEKESHPSNLSLSPSSDNKKCH